VKKEVKLQKGPGYPAAFAYLGLVAVYLGFLSVGFVFHFLPPILPVVINDLGLSHGQAGLLMSLFALPGILLSLPGGWLVDRYGERLIGSLGLVLMGAGTLVLGLAPSFLTILMARALSGVGAMIGVVALQRLVVRLFSGRSLGLPLGISGSAIPIGIVIVLNAAGPLAESSGWRTVAQRVGGVVVLVSVVFAAVVWLITRGQALGQGHDARPEPLDNQRERFRPIWIGGAVWFCANGAMTAFMTFAPDHFQGLGLDVSARGLVTSIPMWISAALGMITGWLTDRHGGRSVFMATGMALMGGALVLLPAAVVPPSLIGLVLGLSLAAVVTPTIALPGVLLPASHTGRGYGILATCANLGIFVVPPVAGAARDMSGSYVWPFVIMGLVAWTGVAAADLLRRGRYMPGFTRHVLAAALLLLVGCGSQDRYEVVAPGVTTAGTVTLGHITDLTTFPEEVDIADAWSVSDIVVAGRLGQVLRVQGDLVTDLRFPVEDRLAGVLCQSDGDLWLATRGGEFWRWSQGVWQQQPSVPSSQVWGLARDHRNRPVAWNESTEVGLFRFEDGAWSSVGEPTQGSIRDVWAHPLQGTWVVTNALNILQLTEAGAVWTDSLASLNPEALNFGDFALTGDGGDRLALTTGGPHLLLREAGLWSYRESQLTNFVGGLFWRAGRLYAGNSARDLVVWGAAGWEVWQEDALEESIMTVATAAQDTVLVQQDGSGHTLVGDRLTRVSPAVRHVDGVAEYEGRLMALLNDGSLFQAESVADGVWRHLGRTPSRPGPSGARFLYRDDRGRLITGVREGLAEWTGADFVRLATFSELSRILAASDGEIFVTTYSDDIGSLRGGALHWWRAVDHGIRPVRGVRRHSLTELDILSDNGLHRLPDQSAPSLQWGAVGWSPEELRTLTTERAVVLGYRHVHEILGDVLRDVTPLLETSDGVRSYSLDDVCALPDGRLLGYVRAKRAFLIRDENGWQLIDPLSAPSTQRLSDWSSGRFLATEHHGLLLYGADFVARVDLNGGAP
jgi:MFS family permease